MTSVKKVQGFTIVELLIVIVVIAILAALVISAYTGIQGQAHDSSVKTDLRNFSKKLSVFYVEKERYPALSPLAELTSLNLDFSKSHMTGGNSMIYCTASSSPGQRYGIAAVSKSGNAWKITNDNQNLQSFSWPSGSGSGVCPAIQSGLDGWAWGTDNNGNELW